MGVENNSILTGRVYIGIETSGSVDRVEFRLDGPRTATWTEQGAPWWLFGNDGDRRVGWDTTGYPDGSYRIRIAAIGNDNSAATTERTFLVANRSYPAGTSSTGLGSNGVFLSPARVQAIRRAVSERRAPNYEAYQRLTRECTDALEDTPSPPRTLYVPPYYDDPGGHSRAKDAVKTDSNNAYALALCYRITGNETFARGAARIIRAWSTTLTQLDLRDDTRLVLSYHFPSMIFAADLLRGSSAYTSDIHSGFVRFLKDTAIQGSSMNTVSRVGCGYKPGVEITNNWSNFGVAFSMSIAVFVGDRQLFDQTVQKWQSNVGIQVDDQGNLPIEGRRNNCTGDTGLHYTNLGIQPLTIAAEIAGNYGVNLFQDQRYQRAVRRTAEVDRYPSRFPFFDHRDSDYVDVRYKISWLEIAGNHIPDGNASWLLQQFRPVSTSEVIRYATLTHGGLSLPIAAQSSGNWPVVAVRASGDDGNIPAYSIDNNYATRWSAEGDGQHITYDLGQQRLVGEVLIAFYRGNERTQRFNIALSGDRTTWSTVFDGQSSGTSLELQRFAFAARSARYVRITGYRNSLNDWNSLTEVRIR